MIGNDGTRIDGTEIEAVLASLWPQAFRLDSNSQARLLPLKIGIGHDLVVSFSYSWIADQLFP